MRSQIVGGPGSRLHGTRCKAGCRRRLDTGDVVIVEYMPNDSYREDHFAAHTDCVQALIDAAPAAPPPRHATARHAAIARAITTSGNLYVTL